MSGGLSVQISDEYLHDFKRLLRRHRSEALDILDIVRNELSIDGAVGPELNPHVLNNSGGLYNGCVEFHAPGNDDVLVLYSPANPRHSVTLRRICTHAELSTGVFNHEWPND